MGESCPQDHLLFLIQVLKMMGKLVSFTQIVIKSLVSVSECKFEMV